MNMKQEEVWHKTACMLCSLNCGIKVKLDEAGRIANTRGDDDHPASQGYLCNKASRIGYYQYGNDRLMTPLKRNADGEYDPISWETAIAEISQKLAAVRDTHGGDTIFYFGGGSQGNHSPGIYAQSLREVLGIKYRSNAIAQEKTGEFWVTEQMFGAWNHPDFENAEVAVFLGKNPWQAHGVQRARVLVREIAKDPDRTLVVIDPKRTETADLADIHLALQPASDAWLLAGMIATIVQEDLINHAWVAEHTDGLQAVKSAFADVDVADMASKSGIEEDVLRSTTRLIAKAKSAAVIEDLGVQMNRHSTLVSYLQRLMWLLCGHFGRAGTHYTTNGMAVMGSGAEHGRTPVLGEKIISGLVPCNVIATEALSDHPKRYRAMIVDSANPVLSLANSQQWREAMRSFECSVVIDVAMTETAREADYVLPAKTQFEKAEYTFFNFEFPENYFHLRRPFLEAPAGPKEESEIYTLLVEALGALPGDTVEELRGVLTENGRDAFRERLFQSFQSSPELMRVATALLYRTLGPSLPEGMQNAAGLWLLCQQYVGSRAQAVKNIGLEGEGPILGEALFDLLLDSPSGSVVAREEWGAVWERVPDQTIHLQIDELLADAEILKSTDPKVTTKDYPFVLSAGERRAYTANLALRDPAWRKKDVDGALHINPEDAAQLNLGDGSPATVITARGQQRAVVELNDRMLKGHISLPNGYGMSYPEDGQKLSVGGASTNELTDWADKDEYAGTPWHKSVPARIEAVD